MMRCVSVTWSLASITWTQASAMNSYESYENNKTVHSYSAGILLSPPLVAHSLNNLSFSRPMLSIVMYLCC